MKTLVFILLFCPFVCLSQDKVEEETRLDESEVPSKAIDFVKGLNFNTKVKWFHEKSDDSHSLEAKTKFQKRDYSIEFDSLGVIQDIEMIIQWDELNEEVKSSIDSCLINKMDAHKVKKIQAQYSGSEELLQAFDPNNISTDLIKKYEIVIIGKQKGEVYWFECTFDEHGHWEKTRRIVLSNSDNLEY